MVGQVQVNIVEHVMTKNDYILSEVNAVFQHFL